MNRLQELPETDSEKKLAAVKAQLARAESEAGELTAIIAEIEHRAKFMRRYLPNTAGAVIKLCERGKSYTCGADFLQRLGRAEAVAHSLAIYLKN